MFVVQTIQEKKTHLKETIYSSRYFGLLKFIYSEKATNFCEISTVDLSYVVTVKSMVEISQNFVAFSEYMNFTTEMRLIAGLGV